MPGKIVAAGTTVADAHSYVVSNAAAFTAAGAATGASIEFQAIEAKIRGFAESTKTLMRILDEVTKIHPFVAVAVLAFKAVVTLELKRRDNDQKVTALKVTMADMMSVLVQLRNLRDSSEKASDGSTIKSRLQDLIERIAEDIKGCGNLCDAYEKKSVVVRVLKGPIWEGRLADFASIFSSRRQQLHFAIAVHTSLGVDSANRTLANVQKDLQSVDAKLDSLILRRLMSPREKELLVVIEAKGGIDACLEDDTTLKELSLHDQSDDSPTVPLATASRLRKGTGSVAIESAFEKLKPQLREVIDDSLRKNMVIFERKFDVQKRQLVLEMETVVHREGDRVINAISSGPHDRIIDTDLHLLWKDMGWKCNVKGRHFILALRDYFTEKLQTKDVTEFRSYLRSPSPAPSLAPSEEAEDADKTVPAKRKPADDRWTLAYISTAHVQPLVEAFDDDGAGFVSVKEANVFTSSRPRHWSLPQWLAYWAAGWHCTLWDYRCKIQDIMSNIFSSLVAVLPINRQKVDGYLATKSMDRIELLLHSVTPYRGRHAADLRERVKSYVLQEEEQIRGTLEAIKYEIDAQNTLTLITGQGHIERCIFPLLYLVLQRHLQIIRIAQHEALSSEEFDSLAQGISYIFKAVDQRIANLESIFKQSNLDAETQLRRFAFGMFQRRLLNPVPTAEGAHSFWEVSMSPFGHCGFMSDDGDDELDEYYGDYDDGDGDGDGDGGDDDDDNDNDNDGVDNENNDTDNGNNDTDNNDTIDTSILKFGVALKWADVSVYDVQLGDTETNSIPLGVEGLWTGLYFYADRDSTDGLMQFTLHNDGPGPDGGTFHGEGLDGLDGFTIKGTTKPGADDSTEIRFVKSYNKMSSRGRKTTWLYRGLLDRGSGTIEGHWGPENSTAEYGTFRLGRTPGDVYRFRYTKAEFVASPSRARWAFACAAVRYQVRRKLWCWAYFNGRATMRKRFLELYYRRELWYQPKEKLSGEEMAELHVIEQGLSPADALCYRSLATRKLDMLCIHFNVCCDVCSSSVIGARVICLKCTSKDCKDEINLCLGCSGQATTARDFVHEPSHDLVKVARVVHNREKAFLFELAKHVIDQANELFRLRRSNQDADTRQDSRPPTRPATLRPEITCSCCESLITGPCWFCICCGSDTIICDDCDQKDTPCLNKAHKYAHPLIRAGRSRLENLEAESLETKLQLLEARMDSDSKILHERLDHLAQKLDGQANSVNERLANLESKVEGRLAALEGLMHLILSKFPN